MTTTTKILIALAVAIASGLLAFLIISGYMGAEPLVGLLGVATGALISELSHSQSAHEDRKNQLRLAALDRRLQAHQEAFSFWRRLMHNLGNQGELSQIVLDCQEWWNDNCLYLTADARQAFSHAYMTAATHYASIAAGEKELVLYETQIIRQAGNKIIKGVELPPMSEDEEKVI
jgi:hypothetical protein